MSMKYSIAEIGNPLRPEDPKKFYAKAQAREEKTLNHMAADIAFTTAMSQGDVLNVLRMAAILMGRYMSEGDSVSMGDFGKFQFHISSHGADTRDEFNQSLIKKVRVQFRPGIFIRESLKNLTFEQTLSVKSRMLAEKLEREGKQITG